MSVAQNTKYVQYINHRLGFKANIPEEFYKDQKEFEKVVTFGETFGYFIGSYPGDSINNLYNYTRQRIQNASVIKDEYTYLRDLPMRICILKSRSLHFEMNYVQGKRSTYNIAFFAYTERLDDQKFGILNMLIAIVYSKQLQSILNSFEELSSIYQSNSFGSTPYSYEGGLMSKQIDVMLSNIGMSEIISNI